MFFNSSTKRIFQIHWLASSLSTKSWNILGILAKFSVFWQFHHFFNCGLIKKYWTSFKYSGQKCFSTFPQKEYSKFTDSYTNRLFSILSRSSLSPGPRMNRIQTNDKRCVDLLECIESWYNNCVELFIKTVKESCPHVIMPKYYFKICQIHQTKIRCISKYDYV